MQFSCNISYCRFQFWIHTVAERRCPDSFKQQSEGISYSVRKDSKLYPFSICGTAGAAEWSNTRGNKWTGGWIHRFRNYKKEVEQRQEDLWVVGFLARIRKGGKHLGARGVFQNRRGGQRHMEEFWTHTSQGRQKTKNWDSTDGQVETQNF